MKLRDYQQESIEALFSYFENNEGNPLIELPTGAGKSVVVGEFCRRVVKQWPNQRIIMLTHVKELIEQNYEKLLTLWPTAPTGIYSASLNSRDLHQNIIFAGIQSVHNRAFEFGKFDLVIIDECHLVNNKAQGTYRKFIDDLSRVNPHVKVIGFTATPFRLNNGLLTDGDERIFTDIAYKLPIKKLIDDGYLSPVRTKGAETIIDLSEVKSSAGDYVRKDLDRAVHKQGFTDAAIKEIITLGKGRRSWLIFCPSVEYAQEISDLLKEIGISSACITGKTPKQERSRLLKEYKSGRIRAITNCDVLTTGFDAPATDMLVLLRSTKSTALYIQIVGRGMRISPETQKRDCLVLDFGSNVERHGPIDAITITPMRRKGKKVHTAPTKQCPY